MTTASDLWDLFVGKGATFDEMAGADIGELTGRVAELRATEPDDLDWTHGEIARTLVGYARAQTGATVTLEGEVCYFRRVRTVRDADLGYALTTVGEVAAVHYPDTVFTPTDWQGQQPNMSDDDAIASASWCDQDGQPAVMLGGLPRKLTD